MWVDLALQWSPAIVPVISAAAAVIASKWSRKRRERKSEDEPPEDHDHEIAIMLIEGLQADNARLEAELRDKRHDNAALSMKVYALETQLGRRVERRRVERPLIKSDDG